MDKSSCAKCVCAACFKNYNKHCTEDWTAICHYCTEKNLKTTCPYKDVFIL